jgi:hypothetical protein
LGVAAFTGPDHTISLRKIERDDTDVWKGLDPIK